MLDDVQEAMSSSGGPMKEMLEKGGKWKELRPGQLLGGGGWVRCLSWLPFQTTSLSKVIRNGVGLA